MPNSDTEKLARAIVSQVAGGLIADIVALKVEVARLQHENAYMKTLLEKPKTEAQES